MKYTQVGELREVRRTNLYAYPRRAIREFLANALIHQDFTILGMQLSVEIFSDRLTIISPGASLNDINRLINLPPNSRNEILANSMLLFGFCEKRGSGVDYAIESIEKHKLPAVKFSNEENFVCVTLQPEKHYLQMTQDERIMTCYQHACICFEDKKAITNQSVRERFGIDKRNTAVASRILTDTLSKGLIKLYDPSFLSKKFTSYIPYYG